MPGESSERSRIAFKSVIAWSLTLVLPLCIVLWWRSDYGLGMRSLPALSPLALLPPLLCLLAGLLCSLILIRFFSALRRKLSDLPSRREQEQSSLFTSLEILPTLEGYPSSAIQSSKMLVKPLVVGTSVGYETVVDTINMRAAVDSLADSLSVDASKFRLVKGEPSSPTSTPWHDPPVS